MVLRGGLASYANLRSQVLALRRLQLLADNGPTRVLLLRVEPARSGVRAGRSVRFGPSNFISPVWPVQIATAKVTIFGVEGDTRRQ